MWLKVEGKACSWKGDSSWDSWGRVSLSVEVAWSIGVVSGERASCADLAAVGAGEDGSGELFDCDINRYRIGDAFMRSPAAVADAKSAAKVLGVRALGLYCRFHSN